MSALVAAWLAGVVIATIVATFAVRAARGGRGRARPALQEIPLNHGNEAVTWLGRVAIAVVIAMVAVVALVTGGAFMFQANDSSVSTVVQGTP